MSNPHSKNCFIEYTGHRTMVKGWNTIVMKNHSVPKIFKTEELANISNTSRYVIPLTVLS